MSEHPKEESLEKEKNVDLNNFRFYLPGGAYRQYVERDTVKAQICNAVDTLLNTEFSDLDIPQISATLSRLQSEGLDFISRYRSAKGPEEIAALDKEANEGEALFNTEYDKLRPLFVRLLELGFNERDLTG
jgi:hypothetical protein